MNYCDQYGKLDELVEEHGKVLNYKRGKELK